MASIRWGWLVGLLIGSLPPVAAQVQPLGEGLYWLPGRFQPGQQPDGNSLLIEAPNGSIVIDSGRHPQHTEQLVDWLAARPAGEIVLLNTHWHLDHSAGDARLRARFPNLQLHASRAIEVARDGFLARYREQLEALLQSPQPGAPAPEQLRAERARIDSAEAMRPDVAVEASASRRLAGRELYLGLARGVSGGDVWLYDPDSRLLVAGDLVTLPVPLLDTACPELWREELAVLAQTPFERVLPGHGRLLQRSEFERWRAGYQGLLDCAAGAAPSRDCAEQWLVALGDLLAEHEHEQARGMLDYYLDEILRNPQHRARYCAG